jgi:small-conductance mechanosensitive channel
VDLQELRQQEMAAQVQKVRARARPWASIISLLIAIAAAIAAETLSHHFHASDPNRDAVLAAGAAVFGLFGVAGAVGLSGKARTVLQPVIGQAHAGVVRYVFVLVGVFAILVIALAIGQVPVSQLLVSGAVVGVLLGIAAQQSLANLFAGLVLLFARPFRVGDHVRFRAGVLSGQIEGVVVDVSLTYVRLETDEGIVLIPNAQALAAAVLLVPGKTSDGPPPPTTIV